MDDRYIDLQEVIAILLPHYEGKIAFTRVKANAVFLTLRRLSLANNGVPRIRCLYCKQPLGTEFRCAVGKHVQARYTLIAEVNAQDILSITRRRLALPPAHREVLGILQDHLK